VQSGAESSLAEGLALERELQQQLRVVGREGRAGRARREAAPVFKGR
jgi:hypothetical protein